MLILLEVEPTGHPTMQCCMALRVCLALDCTALRDTRVRGTRPYPSPAQVQVPRPREKRARGQQRASRMGVPRRGGTIPPSLPRLSALRSWALSIRLIPGPQTLWQSIPRLVMEPKEAPTPTLILI